MGLFYNVLNKNVIRCVICGCHMYSDSDSDVCEVCLDELYNSDPGGVEDEI